MNRREAVAAALRELKDAAAQPDGEEAHTAADAALCRLIQAFGYSQIVTAYRQVFQQHYRNDYPPATTAAEDANA